MVREQEFGCSDPSPLLYGSWSKGIPRGGLLSRGESLFSFFALTPTGSRTPGIESWMMLTAFS